MFRSHLKALSALAVVLVLISTASFAQTATKSYLILSKGQGKGSTAFVNSIPTIGGTVTSSLEGIGVVSATSADPNFKLNAATLPGVQTVAEDPEINWLPNDTVGESMTIDAQTAANTAAFGALQWNLPAISADKTFAAGITGKGARVAVLDAGIVTNHIDLAPNLNLPLSVSFVPGEGLNPPAGVFNHGSHVAGIIAAKGIGTRGVAPDAELVAVKVLRASGSGNFSWLIQGLEYASGPAVHADVINMSLGATFDRINAGGGNDTAALISALNRAINHATQNGSLCISASGNDGADLNSRLMSVPAQSGDGMAVGATTPIGWAAGFPGFDNAAYYSNFGQSVINVAAPGGDQQYAAINPNQLCTVGGRTRQCFVFDFIISPGGTGNAYFFAIGTSMAAPHASGVAALIVSKYGHIGPAALKQQLQQTADDILKPGADAQSGKGRVNAAKAVGIQ